ncbi:MAG: hypothetical protein OFPI_31270 [Osedax symbiont Rs2]|nr:MAG: hypothetical protein OFPI_31270 [Osedax symbiont Rs2]
MQLAKVLRGELPKNICWVVFCSSGLLMTPEYKTAFAQISLSA